MDFYALTVSTDDQLDHYKREVGARLRHARQKAGLTQAEAAALLSSRQPADDPIPPSRIGNYEQGTRLPDPLMMQSLCDIYSTWPSAIYGFSESPSNMEEATLIAKYRRTDDRGRKAIQSIAESQPEYKTSGLMKAMKQ